MHISASVANSPILVVEDDEDFRNLLADQFRTCGFRHVWVAGTGEEALSVIEHENVRLVLSDVTMPGMTGWELARRMNERFGSATPLFLCMSGNPGSVVAQGIDARIDAIFFKPFAFESLENVVKSLIQHRLDLESGRGIEARGQVSDGVIRLAALLGLQTVEAIREHCQTNVRDSSIIAERIARATNVCMSMVNGLARAQTHSGTGGSEAFSPEETLRILEELLASTSCRHTHECAIAVEGRTSPLWLYADRNLVTSLLDGVVTTLRESSSTCGAGKIEVQLGTQDDKLRITISAKRGIQCEGCQLWADSACLSLLALPRLLVEVIRGELTVTVGRNEMACTLTLPGMLPK